MAEFNQKVDGFFKKSRKSFFGPLKAFFALFQLHWTYNCRNQKIDFEKRKFNFLSLINVFALKIL